MLQTISYEDALYNKVIVGTPEFVAMRLRDLKRDLGLTGILAEVIVAVSFPPKGHVLAAIDGQGGGTAFPIDHKDE
jgi:hypothetical protein